MSLRLRRLGPAGVLLGVLVLPLATATAAPAPAGCRERRGRNRRRRVDGLQDPHPDLRPARRLDVRVPEHQVKVRADHTKNLRGRQRIQLSWTGAQPSGGRASNPYGENGLNQEYPVVIMQCRGTDDPSLPAAKQVRPQTCWTGSVAERSQVQPLRGRGGLDPRCRRGRCGLAAGLRHDPVPEREGVPDRGHGGLLHPPDAVRRREGDHLSGLRLRPHASGGGGRRGLPARRDRRLHR